MSPTDFLLYPTQLITPATTQISSSEIYMLSSNPGAIDLFAACLLTGDENWAEQLTADIKPTVERKKIKVEAKVSPILTDGKLPSITSKAVIRAAMNERVKKLERL